MISRPLWITLKYLLRGLRRRPATVLYPFEKIRLPYQWRGLHRLDDEKCTGCGSCARACPNICIDIVQVAEKKKRPAIDIGRCLFCGYCVDVCPFDALHMTGNYELAVFTRAELLMSPERLSKVEDVREGTIDEEMWKRVYRGEKIPDWPPLPEKPSKAKKEPAKEGAKEPAKEPGKEAPKEPPKEPAKEPGKEAPKEPPKDAGKEPAKAPEAGK